MRNVLFKAGLAILSAACLFTGSAQADECCQPDCNWRCGDFAVGVDGLYWKAMQCPFHYASEITMFESSGTPARSAKNTYEIKADYDWGFRLHADYGINCSLFGISYLYYRTSERASREPERSGGTPPNRLVPTNLPLNGTTVFDIVKGTMRLEYQNADFRYGQFLHRSCDCNVYAFGNVRWVDLQREDTIEALEGTNQWRFEREAEFKGVALGVGLGGRFHICNGFYAYGEINTMGVIGNTKTPKYVMFDGSALNGDGAELTTNFSSPTCVIPALDFRLALNYTFCCDCVDAIIEVGYEVNHYWNALAFPNDAIYRNVNIADIATDGDAQLLDLNDTRGCHDIGFAGPYFGVTIQF